MVLDTAASKFDEAVQYTKDMGRKQELLWALEALITLITNDQILAGDIAGLNTEQLIELAKTEAAKAVQNSQALIDSSRTDPPE